MQYRCVLALRTYIGSPDLYTGHKDAGSVQRSPASVRQASKSCELRTERLDIRIVKRYLR